ncbi:phage holin family protein [Atopobacter phocae]|uniref:phage holin family protein n=1 Tax=Atopobacter phocae TaxID=136492 RepID=UPI000472FAF6|nr:phage holin family protein [Atopobacter phocae]
MRFGPRLLVTSLSFLLLSALFQPYFYVASLPAAVFASLLLSGLNTFVKPILYLITIPITIFTLGLFTFVLNAIVLQMVSGLMGNQFQISSFFVAIIISLFLSTIQDVAYGYLKRSKA